MKWVLKTASVRVATKDKESVFRSIEDVPPELREEIREALSGPNAETIYIANQEACKLIQEHQATSLPGEESAGEQRLQSHARRFAVRRQTVLAVVFPTISALALLWLFLIQIGKP